MDNNTTFQGLRSDHSLEGASNFCAWKEQISVVLEDSGVLDFVKQQIVPHTNPKQFAQHNKNDTKVKRIILEGIGDHIIPHLHEKKIAYEMLKAILDLYKGSNDARKLALKENLRGIWMSKGEPIITYLSKFTHVRDELSGVGEMVAEKGLVSLALLRLHKYWYSF